MKLKASYLLLGLSLWQFIVFFVVLFSFQLHFQSLKDVEILLNISAKFLANNPNPFVFHTHILISQLLSYLCDFGNTAWYSYFLLTILGISFVAISFKICTSRQGWRGLLTVFLCSILLEIPILTKLNFEVVAGVLAIAGTVSILPKQSNKINTWKYIFGFLLLFFAFLLSISTFILISVPCFLFVFSQTNKKYFKQTILSVFVLMMLALGAITADWYNENTYRTKKAWHIFREMQELSQKLEQIDIQTCNQDPDCEATLAKVNWTLNDFRILQNGFVFPNETFSNYKIKTFIEEAHLDYTQKHKTEESEYDLLITNNYNYLIISSLSIFLFTLLLYFKSYKRVFKTTFFAIILLVFSLLSVYFFKLSVYLLSPLWVLLAILPSLWGIPLRKKEASFKLQKLNKFQLVSLSFLTMLILIQIVATLFNQRLKTASIPYQFEDKALVETASKNPTNLYILWEKEAPFLEINPFGEIIENQKNIFCLHKYQQSPALQNRLTNFEITDLYKNLVETENLFLVIENKQFKTLSKIYKLYISEHYDLLIKFERQNKEGEKYGIYSIN